MGKLTTHILDTMHGRPAAGVAVRLYSTGGGRRQIAELKTNADGRSDTALLDGNAMESGEYELEFDMGDYFRHGAVECGDPAFLNTVVIRFSMQKDEHYHVPLLATPWSYSTYRGS